MMPFLLNDSASFARELSLSGTAGSVWTSRFYLAKSAIVAGHTGRVDALELTTIDWHRGADREKTILSSFTDEPPTAREWISFWGRGSIERASSLATLGAGTPFVCLYLFGWCFGKHRVGWVFGIMPIIATWAMFTCLTFQSGHRFVELWLSMAAFFAMSGAFFYARIYSRTPKNFPASPGLVVALLLETLLSNSLTCIGHGAGILAEDCFELSSTRTVVRFLAFLSPVALWVTLHEMVVDRQATLLRERNMGNMMGQSHFSREETRTAICRYIENIIDLSRDLRVTGLKADQLDKLAGLLSHDGCGKVAEYVKFYTRGARPVNTFDYLLAFHRGYTFGMASGTHIAALRDWVKKMATCHEGGAFEAIMGVKNGTGPPVEAVLLSVPSAVLTQIQSDREALNWWLCGVIADYRDSIGGAVGSGRRRHVWYALMAAGLCADRDALAVMRAMALDDERQVDARTTLQVMRTGCEQVLEDISHDENIYKERGLVITSTVPGSAPKIIYSAAQASQARLHKPVIIMGKSAFNTLWGAWPSASSASSQALSDQEKHTIVEDSHRWSSSMMTYLDIVATVALSIDRNDSIVANIRVSAWRGWLMHSMWVALTVTMHFLCPHRLLYMAAYSSACTMLDWKQLYIQVVYSGFHLWRSSVGRLHTWFPITSDSSISFMTWQMFYWSIALINWLALMLGMLPTVWGRTFFLLITCSSTLPGFAYLMTSKWDDCADGLMKYEGRPGRPDVKRGHTLHGIVSKTGERIHGGSKRYLELHQRRIKDRSYAGVIAV